MGFESFVGEEGAYVGWDGVVPALRDDDGAGFGCVVVVADSRGWIMDQRREGETYRLMMYFTHGVSPVRST